MADIARTDDKSNGHCEKETPLHLTIDTTTSQRETRPPLLASIAETEAAAAAAAAHYTDDDFDQNHLLSDKHPRMRAMSDSERALFSSGTGVRIPQKHSSPSPLYTQLTPPLSYSPANFDIHNPYSTSAHMFPADSPPNGLPDTPQSAAGSSLLPKRSSKTLRSSLTSAHHPRQTSTHTDGVARSQSYSFGGHSRQTTFVDASSYDTVPDSPAKNVLMPLNMNRSLTFACSGYRALPKQPRPLLPRTMKVKRSAHTLLAARSESAVSASSKKPSHSKTAYKSNTLSK